MRKIALALLLIVGFSPVHAQDWFVTQNSATYGTNVSQDDVSLYVGIGNSTPTSILTVAGSIIAGASLTPNSVVEIYGAPQN